MNAIEARTADDLLALAATATPAIAARPRLAEEVLARARRRQRRRRLAAVGAAVAVTGALAASALPGRGDYFEWVQPSGAMVPTVAVGQTVVFEKNAEPLRGDVVLLAYRDGFDGFDAVSRVVGLPGDTVACPDNGTGRCDAVVVNGAPLDEPWLDEPTLPFAPVPVGSGQVFVLGDARANANDSRFVGPQRLSDVKGAAVGRVEDDGTLTRLPGTPDRSAPDGENHVDPADPVPPARVGDRP